MIELHTTDGYIIRVLDDPRGGKEVVFVPPLGSNESGFSLCFPLDVARALGHTLLGQENQIVEIDE